MGMNVSGGRFESPQISTDQAGKIRSALIEALNAGEIDQSVVTGLLGAGEAGLVAAMNMSAVQDRMNQAGGAILSGK